MFFLSKMTIPVRLTRSLPPLPSPLLVDLLDPLDADIDPHQDPDPQPKALLSFKQLEYAGEEAVALVARTQVHRIWREAGATLTRLSNVCLRLTPESL